MELDEFISQTLRSLIKSINDTTEYAESNGAIINPIIMERMEDHDQKTTIWRKDKKDGRRILTKVDFDVAVNASTEGDSKKGGGIKIQVFELGASVSESVINQTSSRIKFSLNLALPHQGDK